MVKVKPASAFTFKAKTNLAFNFKELQKRVGKNSANAMRRAAAQLRTRMEKSIRRSSNGKPSNPGESPRHQMKASKAGLRLVEFVIEETFLGIRAQIGPIYLPSKSNNNQNRLVTNTLEFGGTVYSKQPTEKRIRLRLFRGRLAAYVDGKRIKESLPPNYKRIKNGPKKGAIINLVTGKLLNAKEIRAVIKQGAVQQAGTIGRKRKYKARPNAAINLKKAIAAGVIPREFSNLVRS